MNVYTFQTILENMSNILIELIEGKYAYDVTGEFHENGKLAYKFKAIKQY